ncbi:sphingosine kinase [Sphingopyxis sp. XHP0097]|uniref:Sphingosine kinase n=1 Tax=Sphingopyxis jiangsuensis TaxID=2871171 RepID=A0ABS7M9J7_9SPHN|nr:MULTISPECIES: diacylglycerol kinase family protein [Sphingopyxis]MBY4635696.1 sphingosine kinase [Sphingopyxis jiangsuensis]
MTPPARRPALVCNSQSGSFDSARRDWIAEQFAAAGTPLVADYCLPDQKLPDPARLVADGVDLAVVWGGDGTINASVAALAGWDGTLLALPGGTLNLLVKQLHGERELEAILADVLSGRAHRDVPPTVACAAGRAMVNMLAGPTTVWAEVREHVRQRELASAAALVPEALEESLAGDPVRLAGDAREFQAISMTPSRDGIVVDGLYADSPTLLLRHAIAWVGGDFRDGPRERLTARPTVTISSDAPLGLLMDGEHADGAASVTFRIEPAPMAMLLTMPLP